MRVLIPNHFPLEGSGSGTYTLNVARQLLAKGHQAFVICPGHEDQRGYQFGVRTILFTPSHGDGPDGDRLPFNFPCFTTHPRSSTRFGELSVSERHAYVAAFREAIEEVVVDWKPELIHAQHLWVTGYAAAGTGLPYVVTAHGTDLMGFRSYPAWRQVALDGARRASAVIAISRQVAGDAMDLYGIGESRVHLIMNGFDGSIFKPMDVDRGKALSDLGIDHSPDGLVIFVGKLTHFKGVDVLLKAAASYETVLKDVMTLIVGDGELHDELVRQAKASDLRDVHFVGQHPQSEVARLLNIADVSVVPSRTEPFGLVAVEAMACGTPVIATEAGGLVDVVDRRVGWLVEVDNPDQLASAVVEAVKEDGKAHKGPAAARRARMRFAWSKQVDKMIAVYEEALSG